MAFPCRGNNFFRIQLLSKVVRHRACLMAAEVHICRIFACMQADWCNASPNLTHAGYAGSNAPESRNILVRVLGDNGLISYRETRSLDVMPWRLISIRLIDLHQTLGGIIC